MLSLATASTPPFPHAGELAATLSALVWASAGIGFASIKTRVDGASLNFGKNLTGVVAFAVFMLATRGNPAPWDLPSTPLLLLLAAGVLGIAICDTYIMRSLLLIGPQRMSLVFCLAPVLTALGAMAPPFSEYPAWIVFVGMGLTVAGIMLAIRERGGGPRALPADVLRQGIRAALIGATLQACTVLLTREAMNRAHIDGSVAASLRLTTGAIVLALWGARRGMLRRWWSEITAPGTRWRIAGSAFFGTFIGIWLNQLGIQWSTHTGVATTLNALTPIYLLPLGAIFLRERHGARAWVASLIACGGIAAMAWGS